MHINYLSQIKKKYYLYIYIYKTEAFEAPTIFHVSTVLKNKK